jgi:hypothetical protein
VRWRVVYTGIFEEQQVAFPVGKISPVCNGAFKILLKGFQMLFFSLNMWLTFFFREEQDLEKMKQAGFALCTSLLRCFA